MKIKNTLLNKIEDKESIFTIDCYYGEDTNSLARVIFYEIYGYAIYKNNEVIESDGQVNWGYGNLHFNYNCYKNDIFKITLYMSGPGTEYITFTETLNNCICTTTSSVILDQKDAEMDFDTMDIYKFTGEYKITGADATVEILIEWNTSN